jgi:hypothetical protein
MNKNQIDNLLKFCFLMTDKTSVFILPHDISYIIEKWDRYIGCQIKNNFEIDDMPKIISHWINIWGKENFEKIKDILYFIYFLDDIEFVWSVTNIIGLFNRFFNSEEINDSKTNGLHTILSNYIDHWLNFKEINRDYKLNQIL